MILSGCTTKPLITNTQFPEPPELLMRPAPELYSIQTESATLSQVTETVIKNYGLYHELKIQLESLQNWIKEQNKITNNKE